MPGSSPQAHARAHAVIGSGALTAARAARAPSTSASSAGSRLELTRVESDAARARIGDGERDAASGGGCCERGWGDFGF